MSITDFHIKHATKINGWWVFSLGMATIIAGSVATSIYFAGAISALIWFIINPTKFRMHMEDLIVIVPFLLFFVAIIISPLVHTNSAQGWKIVASNLQLLAIPFVYASLLRSANLNSMEIFVRAIRIGLPFTFLTAIVQRQIFWMYPEGAMGNALVFSTVVVIAMFCSLTGFASDSKLWRNITLIGLASGIGSLSMVLSKTALLAGGFLMIVSFFYLRARLKMRVRNLIYSFIGMLAIAALGLAITGSRGNLFEQRIYAPIQRLIDNGLTPKGIIDPVRLQLYAYGWEEFKENPILGVGLQNTVLNAAQRIEADGGRKLNSFTHLHSEYLNQLVGGGIIGFVSLLLFLLAPLVLALRSTRNETYGDRVYFATVLSGGFAICSLTNLHSGHDILMTFYCFATVILMTACNQEPKSTHKPEMTV